MRRREETAGGKRVKVTKQKQQQQINVLRWLDDFGRLMLS